MCLRAVGFGIPLSTFEARLWWVSNSLLTLGNDGFGIPLSTFEARLWRGSNSFFAFEGDGV